MYHKRILEMDLIEKIEIYTIEGTTQYNSFSDDELLKTFRDTPDKEIYQELKKRKLHKHPLVKQLKK